jgi:TnpA family transposase
MTEVAELSYKQLAWCTNWYLRKETLRPAITVVVGFQHRQTLSRHRGGGTLSSFDGQLFPVPVWIRTATALPRYFGYGQELTFYSWTSDQLSQYCTRVIPATVRDATNVLDAIMDNETELTILEHRPDTTSWASPCWTCWACSSRPASATSAIRGSTASTPGRRTATWAPLLKGKVHDRRGQLEDQAHQASCLNLVTNAVIAWHTVYMAVVVDRLERCTFTLHTIPPARTNQGCLRS